MISYLILFELTPAPRVAGSQKIGDKFSNYVLFYEDFDGDARKELMAWTESYSERVLHSRIVELNPLTFNEIKKRSFNTSLTCVIITNLNRDTQPEIVALRSPNEIVILNNNFDEKKHRVFPLNLNSIKALPDVDNDGIDEIVVGSIVS